MQPLEMIALLVTLAPVHVRLVNASQRFSICVLNRLLNHLYPEMFNVLL